MKLGIFTSRHVLVVQERKEMYTEKSVMHMRRCCFAHSGDVTYAIHLLLCTLANEVVPL